MPMKLRNCEISLGAVTLYCGYSLRIRVHSILVNDMPEKLDACLQEQALV